MSWCPICGPEVETDGDDCCKYCGATARGEGASFALRLREENARLARERNEARAELASLRAQITHDPATCHVCQGAR